MAGPLGLSNAIPNAFPHLPRSVGQRRVSNGCHFSAPVLCACRYSGTLPPALGAGNCLPRFEIYAGVVNLHGRSDASGTLCRSDRVQLCTKEFNERTKNDMGLIIPVVITVYADRSFTFITKTPPAAVLIKKECNIESGSGVPNKTKVATISKASIQKIAEIKMKDLNAASLESAMSMIAGTCRSMGVVVGD